MGVKCLGLGAISNPATGTIDGWVHDPEFYLLSAKKCLNSLRAIIWKVIERYNFNDDHNVNL
jgi:hypothetical protein